MDLFNISTMLENSTPQGHSESKSTADKFIDIVHKLLVEEDKGGEIEDDPMAQLTGLPGGDVWLK